MPTLRRYVNDSGYYLTDYLHGTGFCTWQIGKEGLAYLRERGVRNDGDHVTARDRNHLRDRGWIGPRGEGPGRSDPGASLPPEVRTLAAEIEQWARRGGVATLEDILYRRHGDRRVTCFSHGFLKWLGELDRHRTLADLEDISLTDFEDLARPHLERLQDPLHRTFAHRGDVHVLWQLARIVGLVARQRQGSDICPKAWGMYPVLERLFGLLITEPVRRGSRPPGPQWLASPPVIFWEVDFQQVVAVLAEQHLSGTVRGLTWTVTPCPAPTPPPIVWPEQQGHRVEETRSPALAPAPFYRIEVCPEGQPACPVQPYHLALPENYEPCVLFASDGRLLECGEGRSYPPGEYLALEPPGSPIPLGERKGVHEVERITIGPVGWRQWKGWRLRLDSGTELGPYSIEGSSLLSWELEAPTGSLPWRDALPVWLGSWPRLFVSDAAAFAGAVLEVVQDEPGRGEDGNRRWLRVGTDVPLRQADGRAYLDLAAAAALREDFGTLRLRCRPPGQPDGRALTADFVRLPALSLAFVEDPRLPTVARAVQLHGDPGWLAEIAVEADTEMLHDAEGNILLRALRPETSPGVTAWLPSVGAALRLRVPVTRVGLIAGGYGFGGWRRPPYEGLDLRDIGLEDRLRVELHEEPLLEDGRLLCRLVGVGEVAAGTPLRQQRTFEIELHRWRDALGRVASGVVQIRGCSRWLDIVCLQGETGESLPPPAPPPPGSRARLLYDLDQALERDDRQEVLRLVEECRRRAGAVGAPPGDRDLLPIAATRALMAVARSAGDLREAECCLGALGSREDLPEARILADVLALRLGRDSGLSSEHLGRWEQDLPDCAQKWLLLAEGYYRFARWMGGPAEGSWNACSELASRCLARLAELPCHRPERTDALLLRGLASLVLGVEPGESVSAGPAPSPWLEAVRFAACCVRTALLRPLPRLQVPCLQGEAPTIFRDTEVSLLRLVCAQAAGDVGAARSSLSLFGGWGRDQFFAIGLLRARQARLEGRAAESRADYGRVLEEAIRYGPNFLLDVVAEERGSAATL